MEHRALVRERILWALLRIESQPMVIFLASCCLPPLPWCLPCSSAQPSKGGQGKQWWCQRSKLWCITELGTLCGLHRWVEIDPHQQGGKLVDSFNISVLTGVLPAGSSPVWVLWVGWDVSIGFRGVAGSTLTCLLIANGFPSTKCGILRRRRVCF